MPEKICLRSVGNAGSAVAILALAFAACSENKSKTPTIEALSQCSADGQLDCLTTDAFPAAVKANIVAKAAEISSTITIAGVQGTLAACSGDNGQTCLTSDAYPAVVKANVTPARVKNGLVVAGVTGTYGPDCTSDGQIDCLTVAAFKSGDVSGLSAYDVRVSKTIGGVAGKLAYNKNAADTSFFNRSSGDGSVANSGVVDTYDTIDDYRNGGTFPTSKPTTWTTMSGQWLRDTASDTDTDSTCNGTENCVLKDQNTGLYWAKSDATTITFEAAVTACFNLSFGTYTDWRLPTQKELVQAYIDGIYSQTSSLNLSNAAFRSATTVALTAAANPSNTFQVNPATGEVSSATKTSTAAYICVR